MGRENLNYVNIFKTTTTSLHEIHWKKYISYISAWSLDWTSAWENLQNDTEKVVHIAFAPVYEEIKSKDTILYLIRKDKAFKSLQLNPPTAHDLFSLYSLGNDKTKESIAAFIKTGILKGEMDIEHELWGWYASLMLGAKF